MYTNIPTDLVLKSIEHRWNLIENKTSIPLHEFIKAIIIIINSTFFKFDKKIFRQIFGMPMGSPLRYIILTDRRVKVHELVEATGISHGIVELCPVPMVKFNEFRYELLPHPTYSSDLAPCDYFLLPNLKKWFGGKRFITREQLIAEIKAYFEGLDKSYYSDGLDR
ncbi:SETMR methyltransferase, partial [Acromyrmex heyeri]